MVQLQKTSISVQCNSCWCDEQPHLMKIFFKFNFTSIHLIFYGPISQAQRALQPVHRTLNIRPAVKFCVGGTIFVKCLVRNHFMLSFL